MHRKVTIAIFVFVLGCAIFSNAVFAQEQDAVRKLSRGVCNTIGGLLWDVVDSIDRTVRDEGVVVGSTYGVAKGFLKGIGRTIVGVFETLTFLLPFDEYKPIIDNPEFPFQIEKLKEEGKEY